jgi:antitoxin component of MazEF toxin-antitoxin module
MPTPVKVRKWGSSMAVLIPKQFAKTRRIAVGTLLDLESVRIVRARRPRYTLSELLARFKPRHRHGEWDLGGRVGREVW